VLGRYGCVDLVGGIVSFSDCGGQAVSGFGDVGVPDVCEMAGSCA